MTPEAAIVRCLLGGLWVLTRLGIRADRMSDAVAVLREKRQGGGSWLLEGTPQGRMQANPEKQGCPSKWVTLIAPRVLGRRPALSAATSR
jgi:hypothetical protein